MSTTPPAENMSTYYGEKLEEEFEASGRAASIKRDAGFWASSPSGSEDSFRGALDEVVPFKRSMMKESPSPVRPPKPASRAFEEKTMDVEDFNESDEENDHRQSIVEESKIEEKPKVLKKKKHSKQSKKDKAEKKKEKREKKEKKDKAKKKKKKKKVARPPPSTPVIAQSPSENILKLKQSGLKKRNLSENFDVCVNDDEEHDEEYVSDEDEEEDYDRAHVVSPLRFDFKNSSQASARKKKKTQGHFHEEKKCVDVKSPLKPLRDGTIKMNDFTRCLIVREKGGLLKKTVYYMHIQNKDDDPVQLILAAQKSKSGKTPNYHIFDMTKRAYGKDLSKKSGNYIGKLRTSFGGSACTLFDTTEAEHCSVAFSKEHQGPLSRIKQETDPRVMRVLVPKVNKGGKMRVNLKGSTMNEKLMSHLDIDKNGYILPPEKKIGSNAPDDEYQILGNKSPTFVRGSYRLNFGGRVLLPSVKNFQLCDVDEVKNNLGVEITNLTDIFLQFGKISGNEFHLDFKEPLTPFQAFGIMLAQFNFSF